MFDIFYTGPKPNLFPFEQPVSSYEEAQKKAATRFFWLVDGNNDYSNFDFTWMPPFWEQHQAHAFPGRYNKDSGTIFSPRAATEVTNYTSSTVVLQKGEKIPEPDWDTVPVIFVDHSNEGSRKNLPEDITVIRFVSDYAPIFKKIANTAQSDYVWIISSLCDYTNFDFSWRPPLWQSDMLHVFPSNDQIYGDTFFVRVSSIPHHLKTLRYCDFRGIATHTTHQSVPRLPMDVIEYDGDDLTQVIKNHTFSGPYAVFKPVNTPTPDYTPVIWRQKDRAIHSFTESNAIVLAPRDCRNDLRTQCYDFARILRHSDRFLPEKDLDIVFISNGEKSAEKWFAHLQRCAAGQTIHRVRNINGRALAYKLAALKSTTPWFFAVFGKFEVDPNFNWHWQPDYFQNPKHYIFQAQNPVNNLVYGHMAIIAYNKNLVLETADKGWGLDFTLSQPHESVNILSGIGHYNDTPKMTWRTAFREVIKLLQDPNKDEVTGPKESNNLSTSAERLQSWLTIGNGQHGEWSIAGAKDAVDYFTSVNGEYEKLMLSFEWDWLNSYYDDKYRQ